MTTWFLHLLRHEARVVKPTRFRGLEAAEVPWFELRLAMAVHETNRDCRMHKPISDLAGTVREATAALGDVPDVAAALKAAAVRVSGRVVQVKAMIADLEAADIALADVVGDATTSATSNGGPPLDGALVAPASSPVQPATPGVSSDHADANAPAGTTGASVGTPSDQTLKQAQKTVEAANAAT